MKADVSIQTNVNAQHCATTKKRATSFERSNLTVMEGHCFTRAKIENLRPQYLNDEKDVHWSDHVKEVMRTLSADARNTGEFTLFIHKLSDHLEGLFSRG